MRFVRNTLKEKNTAKLLFRDTDSLVYTSKTDDVYENFYKDKNLFDFSDHPRHSRFPDPVNKKAVGKIKDELK